jgi:hypothetical protein
VKSVSGSVFFLAPAVEAALVIIPCSMNTGPSILTARSSHTKGEAGLVDTWCRAPCVKCQKPGDDSLLHTGKFLKGQERWRSLAQKLRLWWGGGGVVFHNLPAKPLVTGLVGSMAPSDFHFFGPLKIYATNIQVITDANMKHAITLCVKTLDTPPPPASGKKRLGATIQQMLKCGGMMCTICYPCAMYTWKKTEVLLNLFVLNMHCFDYVSLISV